MSVQEVSTLLIQSAYEIILRTRFAFNGRNPNYEKQLYNKALWRLLEFCRIDGLVCSADASSADKWQMMEKIFDSE